MAGILPTDSIIADSTTSSSSPLRNPSVDAGVDDTSQGNAPNIAPPVQVKRVGRTYGRPKPDIATSETPREDFRSRARILKTAPRDADEQVIPESDDANERLPSFDGFDWRAKLKAIDEGLDDSGDTGVTHQTTNASTTQVHNALASPEDVGGSSSVAPLSSLSQLSLTSKDKEAHNDAFTSVVETDTLFSASTLSSLLSPGQASDSPPSRGLTFSSNGKFEKPIVLSSHPRPSYKRVESPEFSDSENASPHHPFPINSPKQRSSPTPPTSPLATESVQLVALSGDESTSSAAKARKNAKPPAKGKGKGKGKEKEKRVKAPTRKEVDESRKESARLLADQHVTIRRTQTQSKHTIANLFNKLKQIPIGSSRDDPITSFSSPGNFKTSSHGPPSDQVSPVKTLPSAPRPTRTRTPPLGSGGTSQIGHQEESEEELPDPGAVLRAHEEKRLRQSQEQQERVAAEKKAKRLEELKRKALEARKQPGNAKAKATEGSDADDDLEIVAPSIATRSHGGRGAKLSLGGKNLKPFGGRDAMKASTSRSHDVSQKSLELSAQSAFIADRGMRGSKRNSTLSRQELNNLLLQRARKQNAAIEQRKKEQWIKAGNVLKDPRRKDGQAKSAAYWLNKGASREDAMDIDDNDEGEDDDDLEYVSQVAEELESNGSDEEGGDATYGEEDVPEESMDVSEEPDVDTDKENHRPAPRRQSARAIVDSDEDDETADGQRAVVIVPDSSFALEDEPEDSVADDKENSAELAFDLSEDKENARVPRLLPRGRNFFGASDVQGTSPLPGDDARPSRKPLGSLDGEGLSGSVLMPLPLAQRRDASQDRILQVLHEEDKDATLAPVTSARKGVLRRGYSSSSQGSDDVNLEGLKTMSPLGFTQLFSEVSTSPNNKEPDPASAIGEGGFSQFFSQGRTQSNIFDASPSDAKTRNPFAQHSRPAASEEDGFQFTQPNTLLPSVRISESQRREIDEMFGKDQEFKLDEARKSREQAKAGSTSHLGPLAFGSFAPSPTQLSPQSIRRPLETLSLESTTRFESSPEDQPLRRGRLLRERPLDRETTPSPSPRPRNAFDVLRDAARGKGKGKERQSKQMLEKSEFVEAEAQESDEEAMLGFGGAKRDDDDEVADEDPDAVVEGLVDDAAMDAKVQGADLVLEKHMEHQAADDAALTKLHQDAVDGKLRGKRRDRGIGFEDSDSEEELRPRKPLYKKRKIEGDTLDAYGENTDTLPFYKAYQAHLTEEDDPTLAYLQQDDSTPTHEMEEDDSSEEHPIEKIAPAEIRRQIREIAESRRSPSPSLDPNDVTWLDLEDQEMQDDIQIEDRPMHVKKVTSANHSNLDHVNFRGSFKQKNVDAREQAQLKTWATQEARMHASASGRGGFSRKEEASVSSRKQGKGSIMTAGSSQSVDARMTTKSSSLLSRVEKRKGFDSLE